MRKIIERKVIKEVEFDAAVTECKICRYEGDKAGKHEYAKGTYVTEIKGIFDFPQNPPIDDVICGIEWFGRKFEVKYPLEWGNGYGDIVIIPDKTAGEYLIEMTIGKAITLPPCDDDEAFSIFNAFIKIEKVKYGDEDVLGQIKDVKEETTATLTIIPLE